MTLRLSSRSNGFDVLLVQGDLCRTASRYVDEVGDGNAELIGKTLQYQDRRATFRRLQVPVIALGNGFNLLVSEPSLPASLPQIGRNPLEKLVRVHASDSNYRHYLSRLLSFLYCQDMASLRHQVSRCFTVMAVLCLLAGCTDPALKKCRYLNGPSVDPEVAMKACVDAAKLPGDEGKEGKALLEKWTEEVRRSEAERIARENAVPEKITEAWCDEFAARIHERMLAGLKAEEAKKKHSRRKTDAYLEQIVSDDAKTKGYYCKDHAGEPTEGYYACMYRAHFAGYKKCEEEEKARTRSERETAQ